MNNLRNVSNSATGIGGLGEVGSRAKWLGTRVRVKASVVVCVRIVSLNRPFRPTFLRTDVHLAQ